MGKGRPTVWEGDLKESAITTILNRIEEGESVRSILNEKRNKDKLPSRRVFNSWLRDDHKLSTQYARAMELRAELMFDEITLIADGTGDDILIDEDGKEQVNHNVIQRDRLRIDARKWALSKMLPKKYGDKLELDNQHSGEIKITRNIKS